MTIQAERNMLSIPNATGDDRIMWDPNNADEVAVARAAFDAAKERKMVAYTVDPEDSGKGEVIRKFDPKAGKIIMARQSAGG